MNQGWHTITAAKRIGVPVDEYVALRRSGLKWCTACKAWHTTSAFGSDRDRGDGLTSRCLESKRVVVRVLHFRDGRKKGWLRPARDGDKLQARRRVNYLVEQGRIPNPSKLPCTDCSKVFDGTHRHEYDHFLGYSGDHQLYVEPVCTTCHRKREESRRG
jgi:hypothetical protein